MEQVVAKFKCNSVTEYLYGKEASFSAVYGNSGENKDFTDATPSGNLTIGISKDAKASDFFVPGGEYYLTFSKAE